MTDLLSTRLEAATMEELPGLLEELANGISPTWSADGPLWPAFPQLMVINTPESLFAAAMMLVPEEKPNDWHWAVGKETSFAWATLTHPAGEHYEANMCSCTAAALAAAIARSLEV